MQGTASRALLKIDDETFISRSFRSSVDVRLSRVRCNRIVEKGLNAGWNCGAAYTVSMVLLCGVMAGCAVVRIESADVVERRYPGVVVLSVTPRSDSAAIVHSRGLGLAAGVSGLTIGYWDEAAFISFDPQACRLFIAVETQAQVEAVVKALAAEGQAKGLCIANRRGEGT